MRRRDLLLLGCTPFMPAMAEGRNRRLDLSAYEVSFATEFGDSQRPLLKSDGGPFSSRFEEWGGLRTLPGNKEEELYVDAGFIPAPGGTDELGRADARPGTGHKPLGVNPFSLSDGALAITAIPTPRALRTSV